MAANKPRKKRESTVPKDESKGSKFIRLANHRAGRAIKYIRAIGNLAGSSYEYNPTQIKALNDALNDAVKVTMARFVPKTAEGKTADATVLPVG